VAQTLAVEPLGAALFATFAKEYFFHIFVWAPGATQIAEYSAIIAISMFAVETQSALTSCPSRLFDCRIAAFVAR